MSKSSATILAVLLSTLSALAADPAPDAKPKDVPALIKDLASKEREQRLAALRSLADLGPKAEPAVPALVELLQSNPDQEVRLRSAMALGNIGKPAVPSVAKMLGSEEDDVRFYAVWILGMIGPSAEAATPAVLKALSDSDEDVRRKAASALGRITTKSEEAVPPLLRALEDGDFDVRQASAESLVRFGKAAVPGLTRALKNLKTRYHAVYALGKIGPESRSAVPDICDIGQSEWLAGNVPFQVLLDPGQVFDPVYLPSTMQALTKIGKAGIPELRETLKDKRMGDRSFIVVVLALLGQDAVPTLVESATDPDYQYLACRAVMRIDPETGFFALLEILKKQDTMVAQSMLDLGKVGNSPAEIVAALIKTLKSGDSEVRRRAAHTLVQMEAMSLLTLHPVIPQPTHSPIQRPLDEIVTKLSAELKDPNVKVRRGAVLILAELGHHSFGASPALGEALQDSDITVRNQASKILRRCSPYQHSWGPQGFVPASVGGFGPRPQWLVPPP